MLYAATKRTNLSLFQIFTNSSDVNLFRPVVYFGRFGPWFDHSIAGFGHSIVRSVCFVIRSFGPLVRSIDGSVLWFPHSMVRSFGSLIRSWRPLVWSFYRSVLWFGPLVRLFGRSVLCFGVHSVGRGLLDLIRRNMGSC